MRRSHVHIGPVHAPLGRVSARGCLAAVAMFVVMLAAGGLLWLVTRLPLFR